MKTNNMINSILKVVALVAVAFGITNCAKDNSNNNNNGINGYRLVNNVCYQMVNGVANPTSSNFCATGNVPQYQLQGNLCYQVVNGNLVQQQNLSLCSANATGMGAQYGLQNGNQYGNIYGSQYGGQVCNGPYTDGNQWVQCGTQFNCSGYTLYNQNNQVVRCQ